MQMHARFSEDPFLAVIILGTIAAFAFLAFHKLLFPINRVKKHSESYRYYLPMKKRERMYIIIALIGICGLLAASIESGEFSIMGVGFIIMAPVFHASARLVCRVGGEYYYSDDWFLKDIKVERPRCVYEGNDAVVIFKTVKKKQRLIQFNIPADDARFFEETREAIETLILRRDL
jgi:hypothetical protein